MEQNETYRFAALMRPLIYRAFKSFHAQKIRTMKIVAKKFSIAVGAAGIVFYLGCMLIMWILGSKGTVYFFNSILHGIDVSSILQVSYPITQIFTGMLFTFILGALAGFSVAKIYNWQVK